MPPYFRIGWRLRAENVIIKLTNKEHRLAAAFRNLVTLYPNRNAKFLYIFVCCFPYRFECFAVAESLKENTIKLFEPLHAFVFQHQDSSDTS